MASRTHLIRFPLLFVVILGLLAGLWAALARLGWALPVPQPALIGSHGPLMIAGVLATLIALERAVALAGLAQRRWHWSYAVPVINGAGGALLVLIGPEARAQTLLVIGSVGAVLVYGVILSRHFAAYNAMMALGAILLFAANVAWLAGFPVHELVHWWIAFLVLTIVGERLELSRLRRLSPLAQGLLLLAVGGYVAGAALAVVSLDAGVRLAGIGQVALASWLFRYDVAGQTIRRKGLPRFVAACLLPGYGWLAVGGALGVVWGAVYAGFQYDALLHAVLLGFVFSMIFGHAPIIFPAITRRQIAFHRYFYVYLAALHLSLILRIAGDLAESLPARQWGGLLNVASVLLFLALTLITIVFTRSAAPRSQADPIAPAPGA